MNLSLKSYVQDYCALSCYMRSKLIVNIFRLNTLQQDVQPDTVGLLLRIQCLLYKKKKPASQLQRPTSE